MRLVNVAVERVLGIRLGAITRGQQEQERDDAHAEEQCSDDFGQRDETGFDHGAGTIPGRAEGARPARPPEQKWLEKSGDLPGPTLA